VVELKGEFPLKKFTILSSFSVDERDMGSEKIYVLKIGEKILPHIKKISSFLKSQRFTGHILIFPGGWEGANLIRKYKKKWKIKDTTTHYMALSVLDMNAYLIGELWPCKVVSNIREIRKCFRAHKVCTFLPSVILKRYDFPQKYDVDIDKFSSDSSACFVAYLLRGELIFLKDVDGLFSFDPRKNIHARFIEYSRADDLIGRFSCIDSTVALLLKKYKLNAWIVNGMYPQRILKIIRGYRPKGTYISCE